MSFELPEKLIERVKRFFPRSVERQKVALHLMYLDHWPNTEEKVSIAGTVDRSEAIVDNVMKKLNEEELFIKPQGSIPLYRYTLEQEKTTELPPLVTPTQIVHPVKPDSSVTPEDTEQEDTYPTEESRINRLEVELHSIKNSIESFMAKMETTVQGLSAKVPDNPTPVNTTSFTPDPVLQEEKQPASEAQTEPVGVLLPGLTRDQLIEIGVNQPGKLRELAGLPPAAEEGVESLPVTTRVVAVDLNTYTQMVYERVVHDGYDGSLSDFLNDAAYKYFEDRGKRLDWVDVRRDRRRLA